MKENKLAEDREDLKNGKKEEKTGSTGPGHKNERFPGVITTRRDFLYRIGAGALTVTAIGSGLVTFDFLWPDVVKQPPTRFKIGKPEDYPINSVTLLPDQKVFVVHAMQGYFYAMSAICPHLGCITKWWKDLEEVRCPCHGSRFTVSGELIAGPAPRGLWHVQIELDARGELIVDSSLRVKEEQILKV